MSNVTIRTNRRWLPLVEWHQLPKKFKREFDYVTDEDGRACARFFRYRGWWYDFEEFERVPQDPAFRGWDGFKPDSFFSGIVVRFDPQMETVQAGTYMC